MVGPWSSKCINKGVNTSRPNKGLGGASLWKTDAFYFSPVPSTSVFADTTRSVRVAVGVRRAGSEWHGVAALATAQWPTKFKPSPQCEVPLCCHCPQSPGGRVRGGVYVGGCRAPGGLISAGRLQSALRQQACSIGDWREACIVMKAFAYLCATKDVDLWHIRKLVNKRNHFSNT